jgi:hypothetical protein
MLLRLSVRLGLLSVLLATLFVVAPSGVASAAVGKPKVSVGDAVVMETDAAGVVAVFKVRLTKGVGTKVKVFWKTADGTATAPGDYAAASGRLVFKGPAARQTKKVRVALSGDDLVEPNETFKLVLTKVKGGKLKRATGTGTIRNDDQAPPLRSLTVATSGNGGGTVTSSPSGISCGVDCAESYSDGTVVTLTATPASGSTFTGWSGGGCTGTGTCVVTMDEAATVSAVFTLQNFTLTVTKSGSGAGAGIVTSTPGGISCGGDCSESYTFNTMVTLTPTNTATSHFTGWSGACTGTGSCVVTMNQARTVEASFIVVLGPVGP